MASTAIDTGFACIASSRGACKPETAWIVKPDELNGEHYALCDKQSRKFITFVNNDMSMHDHLVDLRNQVNDRLIADANKKLMAQQSAGALDTDANASTKRKRTEAFDEIEKAVSLSVRLRDGGTKTVRVRTTPNNRQKLSILFDAEMLDVLTKKPMQGVDGDDDPPTPLIPNPCVKWTPSRRTLYIWYYDDSVGQKRWRQRCNSIPEDCEDFHAKAQEIIGELLEYKEKNHTEPPAGC